MIGFISAFPTDFIIDFKLDTISATNSDFKNVPKADILVDKKFIAFMIGPAKNTPIPASILPNYVEFSARFFFKPSKSPSSK